MDVALCIIARMLETGNAHKESLPDDESFNLVLSMLFSENLDTALKILDTALKSGYTLSLDVFNGCVYSCLSKGRPEWLASVIEKCKVYFILANYSATYLQIEHDILTQKCDFVGYFRKWNRTKSNVQVGT